MSNPLYSFLMNMPYSLAHVLTSAFLVLIWRFILFSHHYLKFF